MVSFTYTVNDPEGLHARPAGLLIQCAKGLESEITVSHNGVKVNAKRIFAVMGLGVKAGDAVEFSVSGEREEEDAKLLGDFCRTNL